MRGRPAEPEALVNRMLYMVGRKRRASFGTPTPQDHSLSREIILFSQYFSDSYSVLSYHLFMLQCSIKTTLPPRPHEHTKIHSRNQ